MKRLEGAGWPCCWHGDEGADFDAETKGSSKLREEDHSKLIIVITPLPVKNNTIRNDGKRK